MASHNPSGSDEWSTVFSCVEIVSYWGADILFSSWVTDNYSPRVLLTTMADGGPNHLCKFESSSNLIKMSASCTLFHIVRQVLQHFFIYLGSVRFSLEYLVLWLVWLYTFMDSIWQHSDSCTIRRWILIRFWFKVYSILVIICVENVDLCNSNIADLTRNAFFSRLRFSSVFRLGRSLLYFWNHSTFISLDN